jgi:hypothetical protein
MAPSPPSTPRRPRLPPATPSSRRLQAGEGDASSPYPVPPHPNRAVAPLRWSSSAHHLRPPRPDAAVPAVSGRSPDTMAPPTVFSRAASLELLHPTRHWSRALHQLPLIRSCICKVAHSSRGWARDDSAHSRGWADCSAAAPGSPWRT